MEIGEDSVIKVSLKWVLLTGAGTVVSLLVGFWVMMTVVLGEVKDDVQTIRHDVSELRAGTDAKTTMLVSEDGDLSKAISDLVAQLEINNQRLQDLAEKLGEVDERLTASIARQQEFEQYVVTRLPVPTSVPEDWIAGQDAIVKILAGGKSDPLVRWYDTIQPIEK